MLIACQFEIAWENRDANYDSVRRLLDAGPVPPGSLIVLPEMFASGFSMDVARVAEPEPSPTAAFLADLARQHASWVIGGLVRRLDSGRGANELAVYDPCGACLGGYRKIQTITAAGESDHYDQGTGLFLFDAAGFRVCPFICYDLRFPELFREAVRRGATLFPVIANWPAVRIAHWETLLRARAIENQAGVIGVNRCGSDPRFAYPGRSAILDALGEPRAEAGNDPTVIRADLDPASIERWRIEFPALRDAERSAFWK